MMDDWPKTPLKHLVSHLNRGVAPDYSDEATGLRVLNQACVQSDGRFDMERARWHVPLPALDSQRGVVAPGDVLVNSTGTGTLGRAALYRGDERVLADGHLTIVRPDPTRLDSRFLAYRLGNSAFFRMANEALYVGATNQTELNREALGAVEVALPSLRTQRAIADFLDAETARIDTLIDKKRRMIELLAAKLEAAISETLFRQGDETQWVALGRLVELLPGFAFASDSFLPSEGVRLLRGVNVYPGRLRWDETVYLDPSESHRHVRFALAEGDLVVGMDRPMISSGMRVAPVRPEDLPALLVQRVARIRPRAQADADYIRFALRSDAFIAHFSPILTGVSVPHISTDQICAFRLPAMPLEKQRTAAAALRQLELQAARVSEKLDCQIELLGERRQALITAAVTGKFAIP